MHSERAMWVHSQLYSEAKKKKKRRYMYHYSQVYHKAVLTAETVFKHEQQQQPLPLQQHCHRH